MAKNSYSTAGGDTATLTPPLARRGRVGEAPQATLRPATHTFRDPAARGGTRLPRLIRFGIWLNRPRRVLLAMTGVWIIAVFDLGFTLFEADSVDFIELNPIAAGLLRSSPAALYAFKFCLLGLGTLILLLVRREPLAELACWFLLATMVYVGVRWLRYYDCVSGGHIDPHLAAPW